MFQKFYKNKGGFTIVEVIIVLSIMSILMGISITAYSGLQKSNDVSLAAGMVVSSLRCAQLRSESIVEDSSWSVRIEGDAIVFKGNDYASRDTAFDKIFDMPSGVSASGVSEVHFSKFFGLPNSTGNITLTKQDVSKTVSINQKGMVDY